MWCTLVGVMPEVWPAVKHKLLSLARATMPAVLCYNELVWLQSRSATKNFQLRQLQPWIEALICSRRPWNCQKTLVGSALTLKRPQKHACSLGLTLKVGSCLDSFRVARFSVADLHCGTAVLK